MKFMAPHSVIAVCLHSSGDGGQGFFFRIRSWTRQDQTARLFLGPWDDDGLIENVCLAEGVGRLRWIVWVED